MALIGQNAAEMDELEVENIGALGELMAGELPGCDDILVRQQLARALREFCRETDACVVSVPSEAVKVEPSGSVVFPMPSAPQGMVAGTVLGVVADGRSMEFEARQQPYPHIEPQWCATEGDKALVTFSVYPKVGGERCPAWFKERYAEAIVSGAMHNLLGMTGRKWSDPAKAAEYGAKYADAIAEASYRRGSAMQGGGESAIPCGGIFM